MRGKSHRKEVAKKLKEQIDAATDPMVIASLSNQLSKFLPRPRQARRPRKPVEAAPSKNTWWGRILYTGPVFDAMSDAALMVHHMAVLRECKTQAERDEIAAKAVKAAEEVARR